MFLALFSAFGFFNQGLVRYNFRNRDYSFDRRYSGRDSVVDVKTKCAGLMVKHFYTVRENCEICNSKCNEVLQKVAQFLNKDQCGDMFPEMQKNGQKILKISYAGYQVSCFKNSLWTDVGSIILSQKPLLIKGLVVAAYVAKAVYSNVIVPFVDGYGGKSVSSWNRRGFYPDEAMFEDDWEDEYDEEDDEDYEDDEDDDDEDDYDEDEDEDYEVPKRGKSVFKPKLSKKHSKEPHNQYRQLKKPNLLRKHSKEPHNQYRQSKKPKEAGSETVVFKPKSPTRISFKELNLYDDKSQMTSNMYQSPIAGLLMSQTKEADKIYHDYGITGDILVQEAKTIERESEKIENGNKSSIAHNLDSMVTLIEPILNGKVTYVNPWMQEQLGNLKDAAAVMKLFYPEIELESSQVNHTKP
eukprot:NODE_316_length_11188_cov_0.303905.p2 type:complete len:411 gc:universal NODE_316_length_11188_cov_0.303905:7487-8719(+)